MWHKFLVLGNYFGIASSAVRRLVLFDCNLLKYNAIDLKEMMRKCSWKILNPCSVGTSSLRPFMELVKYCSNWGQETLLGTQTVGYGGFLWILFPTSLQGEGNKCPISLHLSLGSQAQICDLDLGLSSYWDSSFSSTGLILFGPQNKWFMTRI